MTKQKLSARILGAVITAVGLVLTVITRTAAIAENASESGTLAFALSLILTLLGIVVLAVSLAPQQKKLDTRTLTITAMFAALCYIGFAYFRIDIPVGAEKTAFHLGNVFCVLGALLLGGLWGGLAGAVGLTIADLTSGYVTSSPKTFLLKLCIGLITGLVAHKIFRITQDAKNQRVSLPVATVLSCAAGMAFNIVADPVVGYFYKMYVLGIPQEAADMWAKIGAVTTCVNAVIAVIAATVFYLALRPALKHSKLLPTV